MLYIAIVLKLYSYRNAYGIYLQLRVNCDAEPCQNNATCISVPTGYLSVVCIILSFVTCPFIRLAGQILLSQ